MPTGAHGGLVVSTSWVGRNGVRFGFEVSRGCDGLSSAQLEALLRALIKRMFDFGGPG